MKALRIKTILVLALILMSSIPILSFGFIQAFRWRDFTTSTDEGRAIAQVQALHQEIERVIELRMSALELMAEQIRVDSGNRPLNGSKYYSLLEMYVEKFKMSGAGITGLDGSNFEFYSHVPSKRDYFRKMNASQMGFIESVIQSRDSIITPLRQGQVSPQKIFVIATPIWDLEKKNIRAVIASSVLTEEIQTLSNRIMEVTPIFRFVVLDQQDNVVAESGGSDVLGPPRKVSAPVYANSSSDKPVVRFGEDENGNALHGAIQNLNVRKGITWKILVSQSQDSLHRQERIAWMQVLSFATIGLLISFLIALCLSDLISMPILDLVIRMKKIESGQPETSETKLQSLFGFKETSEALNALAAMTKKMNAYTENLEYEVTQRTNELIKTHKELDEQRVRAIESARLASLGEMAGGIAHEINNPLSIISLITQQQQDKLSRFDFEPERAKEAFSRIDATTHRIAKIIRGLKAFSRDGDRDPVEITTIQSILESTLTFCHEKFKHQEIELRLSLPKNELAIECRPIQISQVLLNLLNNAFDAVQSQPEKWIEIHIEDRFKDLEIRVSDSGVGIKEIYRERIFEPFFTLKGVGKGTGLGLSISKGIIEAHHGEIFVDLASPHTTIVMRIPQKAPPLYS